MRTEPPLKTDKATLAVEALPEGKISVRTAAWEEAQIILKDEVLELRNMDAAFASPGRPASTTTTIPTPVYDPYGSGSSADDITTRSNAFHVR